MCLEGSQPQFERNAAGREPAFSQLGRDPLGMGPQRCLELLRLRAVHAERLLRPDGLGHTVRLNRTIVATEGELVEGLAVPAESPGQDGAPPGR